MALEGHGQYMVGGEPVLLTRRHFSLAHREKYGIAMETSTSTPSHFRARERWSPQRRALTFAIDASNTQLILPYHHAGRFV